VIVVPGGEVPFNEGEFGAGVGLLEHLTFREFVAGDYTVRGRARDFVGNIGPWSAPVTVAHRPLPPPPENLAVVGGVLSWTWSDP
jgi:hypothetical protein